MAGPYPPRSSAPVGTQVSAPAAITQLSRASQVAGIGGLVALISFFVFPFYNVAFNFGLFGSNVHETFAPTGKDLAGIAGYLGGQQHLTQSQVHAIQTSSVAGQLSLLWLIPIAALVAIVVAALPMAGRALKAQTGGIITIIAGAVGALLLLVVFVRVNAYISDSLTKAHITSAELTRFGISFGFGLGFWLSLLGMVAVIVGGVLALQRKA